jgi:hypothetical protein
MMTFATEEARQNGGKLHEKLYGEKATAPCPACEIAEMKNKKDNPAIAGKDGNK